MPKKPQLPASPLTVEQIAHILIKAWPEYAAGVREKLGKPDTGWRTLDQMAKENGGSRAYIDRGGNPVTRALFKKYSVEYHTLEDRQRIVAAWKLARPQLFPQPAIVGTATEAEHGR